MQKIKIITMRYLKATNKSSHHIKRGTNLNSLTRSNRTSLNICAKGTKFETSCSKGTQQEICVLQKSAPRSTILETFGTPRLQELILAGLGNIQFISSLQEAFCQLFKKPQSEIFLNHGQQRSVFIFLDKQLIKIPKRLHFLPIVLKSI